MTIINLGNMATLELEQGDASRESVTFTGGTVRDDRGNSSSVTWAIQQETWSDGPNVGDDLPRGVPARVLELAEKYGLEGY